MLGRKGTILVTTLWIMTLLTLLALGIGIRIGIDVKMIGFFLNSAKAHYLAEAGTKKTLALLQADTNKNVDSLNEIWSCGFDFDEEEYVLKDIELGEGTFTVSHESGSDEEGKAVYLYGASDEEGRLNINEIDDELLGKLPGFSSEIIAAVLDWRDKDSLERLEGAEDSHYEELDNPYECKDGNFSVPEELLLVKGVTREIYDGVKDVITVYGKGKAININTTPESVIALLAGDEFEALPPKIIAYRNGEDGLPGTEDDKFFTSVDTIVARLSTALTFDEVELNRVSELKEAGYFKIVSSTFRIASRGEVKEGKVKKTIEAVVERGKGAPQILYYHED